MPDDAPTHEGVSGISAELLTRFGLTELRVSECLRIQARGSEAVDGTKTEDASDALDRLAGRPLGEILVARGALDASRREEFAAACLPGAATILRPAPAADRGAFPTVVPSIAADADADSPRRTIGKYEIVSELGRGGMGVVYQAYHPVLKAHFALKVLLAGDRPAAQTIRRFEREAQASARLKHPGIVGIHDFGEAEGQVYIAMEFVAGVDLDHLLRDPASYGIAAARAARGPAGTSAARAGINAMTAVEMTEQIARAVHAAHEAGVVHRDLKPQNVMREPSGRLRVMDFGLAKILDDEPGAPGLTRQGATMGTAAYMSPEQASGEVGAVDRLSDVYQVGAILHELLTCRPPRQAATWGEAVLLALRQDPPAPREVNPAIDPEAEAICLKAMAHEKRDRYAGALELAEDCRRYASGEPLQARPAGWLDRAWRRVKKHKLIASAGLAAAATVTTLAVAYYLEPGTLELDLEPAGANVTLAGQTWKANGPKKLDLPAGAYVLGLEASDHDPDGRDVVVERWKTKAVRSQLKHHMGTLNADALAVLREGSNAGEVGISLTVDNVERGSKIRNLDLTTGPHHVVGQCLEHFLRELDVNVHKDQPSEAWMFLDQGILWTRMSAGIPSSCRSGWNLEGLDVDGDGRKDLMHLDGPAIVFRRLRDGEELRRFQPAESQQFGHALHDLGGSVGTVLLVGELAATGAIVTCLDPRRVGDAARLWQWHEPPGRRQTAEGGSVATIADRTGDGVCEVVAPTKAGRIIVLDGRSGNQVVEIDLKLGAGLVLSLPADLRAGKSVQFWHYKNDPKDALEGDYQHVHAGLVDLAQDRVVWSKDLGRSNLVPVDPDGDGRMDVHWHTKSEHGLLDGPSGAERWRQETPTASGGIAETFLLDDDGVGDLLVIDPQGSIFACSGLDGHILWTPTPGLGGAATCFTEHPVPRSIPLVLLGKDGIEAVDRGTGRRLWTAAGRFNNVAVLDWDCDGGVDVIAGAQNVGIVCFDLQGKEQWTLAMPGRDLNVVGPIADADGDGRPELVIHASAALVGLMRGPRTLWRRTAAGPLEAGPVVVDTDGDGRPEVVQLGDWANGKHLACFDGATGRVRWESVEKIPPNRGPGVGVLRGDGRPGLFTYGSLEGEGDSRALVYRAVDGELLLQESEAGSSSYSAPAVADLNGDGTPDVVFQRWQTQDLAAFDGRDCEPLWRYAAGAPGMGAVTAADLDGDGLADVVAPFFDGYLHAVRGKDGQLLWKAVIGQGGSRAPATLGDMTGDGVPDAVVVSATGTLCAFEGRTGKPLWNVPGGSEACGRPAIVPGPAGKTWIVAPMGTAGVVALDASGARCWQALAGRRVLASPAVCDLEKDGRREVVVMTAEGSLVVLDFETGATLWDLPVAGKGAVGDPAVADLDADGIQDIVVCDADGTLQAISGRPILAARRR